MPRDTIEARKRRWREILSGERRGHLFIIPYDSDAPARPLPWPYLKQERIEYAWAAYCRQLERATWLRDDFVPHLNVYTGTEIFAEAFGCRIHRPGNEMPIPYPIITRASQVAHLPTPEVSQSSLAMLFDIGDELRRRAGAHAVMKIVDLQSPMDIAALIWDKTEFFAAMIEAPEAVKELSAKVGALLAAFLDEWFQRCGQDFVAHYPDYYMPTGVTISEDEIGGVNPAMFAEFFAPELAELSARYGGLGVHCCADAVHQWENLRNLPALRVLNLVQPAERLRNAYPYFARDTVQFHSWSGDGPPWEWPGQHPTGSRVVMQLGAGSKDEALMLSNRMWQACGRE
jgi:hypothetical protein